MVGGIQKVNAKWLTQMGKKVIIFNAEWNLGAVTQF